MAAILTWTIALILFLVAERFVHCQRSELKDFKTVDKVQEMEMDLIRRRGESASNGDNLDSAFGNWISFIRKEKIGWDAAGGIVRTKNNNGKEKVKPQQIHVELTIKDSIIGPTPLCKSWDATASKGDSMFVVMLKLEREDKTFNFTSKKYSQREYITGFLGREANSSKNQYWAFLKYPNIYMPTGVSTTYPSDGDRYIFNATTWK